jgi:hypothetical protein
MRVCRSGYAEGLPYRPDITACDIGAASMPTIAQPRRLALVWPLDLDQLRMIGGIARDLRAEAVDRFQQLGRRLLGEQRRDDLLDGLALGNIPSLPLPLSRSRPLSRVLPAMAWTAARKCCSTYFCDAPPAPLHCGPPVVFADRSAGTPG